MPTLLTDDEFFRLPIWEPESRIAPEQKIRTIIENLLAMLEDASSWDRVEQNELLFTHDTGICMQLHRHPADHAFKAGRISQFVAFWMDDMPPFRVRMERDDDRFSSQTVGETFLRDYSREETRETIERIGVIAALSRD